MSTGSASASIFSSYAADPSAWDELRADGVVRSHWKQLFDVISGQTVEDLNERRLTAQQLLSEHGVTFRIFDDQETRSRPWDIDLLPFVISPEDWSSISEGVEQRARLLDLIVQDIYGPQELIRSGVLPATVVLDQPGYLRAFHDLVGNAESRLYYYGAELARAPTGDWFVMADRTDVADGAGYALEHRIVAARSMPQLIRRLNISRLAPFFNRLRVAFEALSPRSTENPRIALLSPGPGTAGYFEDQFLARHFGFILAEGGDLAVRNDQVSLKTLDGLVPIDVIFRRIPEGQCDPVELGGASPHGVPGLLQAIRAGNVAVVNVPGTRIVETPAFMAFLPNLCRTLLGEDLRIPSIATWWCGNPQQLQLVMDRFTELVIKPAFSSAGGDEFIVSELASDARDDLRARIAKRPHRFVAQEKIVRSAAPVWKENAIESGHVALRVFAAQADRQWAAMPGALVRVASTSAPMELSVSAGEFSKDAWVIGTTPRGEESWLTAASEPVRLVRASSQLPSRAADNLFWLGRQLDRAGNTARLARTVAERLVGEEASGTEPEVLALLRSLVHDGMLEKAYAKPSPRRNLPPVELALPKAIFDRGRPTSLRSTVDEVFRLASLARDRISNDTWRSLRLQNSEFTPTGSANVLSSGIEALDRLLLGLAGCAGLIHDGMVRGPAWQFLDMGRRVERCHWIAELLKTALVDEENADAHHDIMNALVDVFDCRITYRSRYMAAVQMAPLLDLLVCDETNPGSLAAQVHALHQHITKLPRAAGLAVKTAEQKHILSALHRVEMADVDALCVEPASDLAVFLEDIVREIDSAADHITRRYLVHSGPLRQVFDEGPGTP